VSALDGRDWREFVTQTVVLLRLQRLDEVLELLNTARVPLDRRGRTGFGFEMHAMTFWVRSRKASVKAGIRLSEH
jgi:hypothetical protein